MFSFILTDIKINKFQ